MTAIGNAPATYGRRPSIRATRWFTPISNIEKLDPPDEIAHSTIRFHPDCPFGEERHPAMVCLVRGIVSNKPQAIHRTALSPDGIAIKRSGKTFRMCLAPVSGGAIKIDPDENVTMGLCIGEGSRRALPGGKWGCGRFGAPKARQALRIFQFSPASLVSTFSERTTRTWQGQKRARIAPPAGGPPGTQSS